MRKKLALLLVALIGILIFPFKTNAEETKTTYLDIRQTQSILTNDVSITGIKFNNYSSTSSKAYGLSGQLENISSNTINISIMVRYYDSNYNIISQSTVNNVLQSHSKIVYLQMSNLSTLSTKYTVADIAYYDMQITTNKSSYTNVEDKKTVIPSQDIKNQYREYVIDAYDINVVVNENNTFDITETITAYFNVDKHGIYRKIPLQNTITRLDGTTSKNRAKVSNVKVNNSFTTTKSMSEYEIKIGSADYTVTGKQTYVIKYTYNIGEDPIKSYDELYYNLIGTEWDTVIGNVTFTITMPKEFDASKLGFSSGDYGSTVNDDITYEVNENIITGKYTGVLNSGQALTVRVELEEGYFKDAGFKRQPIEYLLLIVPIICLIISIIIWAIFGNDDNVVETIEFYPPSGMNSLQVGFLYKGNATNEDVVSLLIYLANKGYIKIEETEEKSVLGKSHDFKITKLKEYDGADNNERIFLEGLFKKKKYTYKKSLGTEINDIYNASVTSEDLKNKFYITMNKILEKVNSKNNKHTIYEKVSLNKKIFIILLIIISLFSVVTVPTIDYAGVGMIFATVLIIGMYIPFYATVFANGTPLVVRIITFIFLLIHSSAFLYMMPITHAALTEPFYLLSVLIGIASITGMVIMFGLMPKRTPYGNEILGKLKGFKTFLETAEKQRLESLVLENPNYFYDILPYTYVLGVSDKWISKFEKIGLQEPDWYNGRTNFSIKNFGNFMSSTMTSARTSMSSSPSSRGGSSGGGSSGGGSGGGGGGSW